MADRQIPSRGGVNQTFRDNTDGSYADEHSSQLRAWDSVSLSWVKVAVDHASGALSVTGSGGASGGGAATIADGADVAQGTTSDLSSANTVIGLLKAIKAAITGTLTVGTHAVTGPLTDTQLRASAVPVSATQLPAALAANGGMKVEGVAGGVAQPVSLATNTPDVTDRAARLLGHVTVDAAPTTAVTGPLTDTQLRASAVPVSLATAPTTPVTIAAAVTANQGVANATPWNENVAQVGGVSVAATAKGAQGTNFFPAQDAKDSGRVAVVITAEFAASATAEAVLNLTVSKDGAASSTANAYVITSGKRLRIQSVTLMCENTLGTALQRAYLRARFNTAGAISTSSPLQGTWAAQAIGTVKSISPPVLEDFPDGLEFLGDGTKTFGFTLQNPDWVTASATVKTYVTAIAFEY